ncbi:MAG: cupredoxin domain-containing protein [Anaerolineales bacterium]|nr:cupredoxin domain-containing protein [Chloroflexota bacterium]MBL6980346.1 cupredoxin domain-containing protein [Anaerolineales bacterium]
MSGILLAALVMAFAPFPEPFVEPTERTIGVMASSFEFSPAEISVNPGDLVTIELTSADVVHGLYIDGYDMQISADPGQTQTLTFTADKSGTFRLRCSVTCGDLHPFMIGKLHVGSNTLLWRGFGLATLSVFTLLVWMPATFRKRNQDTPDVEI